MIALVIVALVACGWVEAAMAPFGFESSAVTFSVAAVTIATGALSGRRNRALEPIEEGTRRHLADASLRLSGILAWMLAAGLVLAVELWELFNSPRNRYPTLSSLANEMIGPGHRIGRAIAFVCWALVGLILASRPRPQS